MDTTTDMAESLAVDLKAAEAAETSFEHTMDYHRDIADRLIAAGWTRTS